MIFYRGVFANFVNSNWFIFQEEPEDNITDRSESDTLRLEQMDRLRRLVLPGLVFLLHNVLHTSEQYQECVRLADIITSEQHKLYKVKTLIAYSALMLADCLRR